MKNLEKEKSPAKMLGGIAEPKGQECENSCSSILSQSGRKNKEDFEKMSMTIEQMRFEVARLYPGAAWQAKVARMPDGQIIAIYKRQVLGKASSTVGGANGRG